MSSFIGKVLLIIAFVSASIRVAIAKDDSSQAQKVKVNVYSGPTECDGENKIQVGYIVGFHFTATIDTSSRAGKLGQKVQSSLDVGVAPSFPIGEGKVIQGLDIGLLGLCKGAQASIIIPPHLAYGETGNPPHVAGGVTLRYDVEILSIQLPAPNDFIKIDANQDGLVSKEEATNYFQGQGKSIDIDALFKDEDADEDGFVSWEEFSGPKGNGPPMSPQQKEQQQRRNAPNPSQQVDSMIELLDTDKNGKLSRSELEHFFNTTGDTLTDEAWNGFDKDKDGLVSKIELLNIFTQQQQQQQHQHQQTSQTNAPDPALQVDTMIEKFDVDKDGKLSRSELDRFSESTGEKILTDEIWDGFDKDKDGLVSREELLNIFTQQQLQQQQKRKEEEIMATFHEMDSDKDNKISKSELTEFLKIVGEELSDGSWERLDVDKDGYLSLTEFLGAHLTKPSSESERRQQEEAAFKKMDSDEDGKLSKSELSSFFIAVGGEMPDGFWEESDLDKDGFVSWEEFVGDSKNTKENDEL